MTVKAVTVGQMRNFPPLNMFTVVMPMSALPPIVPKQPQSTLPAPMASMRRRPSVGVLTLSSTTSAVNNDSN
eukprot:CAMPEP_0180813240 /NCGR_PEP_ID=MMETSP1038_2-20121128/66432_1 /TAXON_ID=632150 /ORGANISM="Azadinium spinosum, Strain 3D9" /LENGTH=71 /DNA_ID=CAMNT_0022854823 /DNA_START=68 /DNA_END=280 /DNA_ORIENTATION=+